MNPLDFIAKLEEARQLVKLGKHAEALSLYATLVEQNPQRGLLGEYGQVAAVSGDFDLADRIWRKFRESEPNNVVVLSRLAKEYQLIGFHSKARALYTEAATLEPRNLAAQLSLASLLARIHGVDEARSAVNKCLGLDPRDEQARYLSAHLDRRENKLEAAERQFRDLIDSAPLDPQVTYFCRSELAHILDTTERYDEAMALLAEVKKFFLRGVNIEESRKKFVDLRDRIALILKSLPRNTLALWAESFPRSERTPVPPLAFLGGHIRSGTTLLERILGAHPAVASYDEPMAFQTIASRVNALAPAIPVERLNFFRERYMRNLTLESGPPGEGKIILDKNPSQTVSLPLMLRAMPELRVLLALRDPRDVMISSYFANQVHPNFLSFERIALHYACVMDVWLAVREWEGVDWMETRYEDIVADLQKEGGRVTKFLGLEWHENQARFYESNLEKSAASTNYSSVTQPVYTKSIGRWRVYEKHLAPILPTLEPYCKKFGYE